MPTGTYSFLYMLVYIFYVMTLPDSGSTYGLIMLHQIFPDMFSVKNGNDHARIKTTHRSTRKMKEGSQVHRNHDIR